MSEASVSAVNALTLAYTIILSFSVTEALRQFVNDGPTENTGKQVLWDRLIALVTFLFLVVPFIHGMNRYVFHVYLTPPRPEPYSLYLLFDVLLFTIEAAVFFVLSRFLLLDQWRDFVTGVTVLLGVDVVWGSLVSWMHCPAIAGWVMINACTIPFLIAIRVWYPATWSNRWSAILCMIVVILRTGIDYWILRSLYFPM